MASNVVARTAVAPKASKLSSNQRFVIQKCHHIYEKMYVRLTPNRRRASTYLDRKVYFAVKAIQEPRFSRERPDSDDPFQQLAKLREDGRARVRFHPPQVSTCVEVSNCELVVGKSNDSRRDQEPRENDTEGGSTTFTTKAMTKHSRDDDDCREKARQGRVDRLKGGCERCVDRLEILPKAIKHTT